MRYGGAIEALDEAGKTGKAEALAAENWIVIATMAIIVNATVSRLLRFSNCSSRRSTVFR